MRVPIQPSTANPNTTTTASVIQRRRMRPPFASGQSSRHSTRAATEPPSQVSDGSRFATSIIPPLAVLAAYAALSRLARSRALPLQHGRDPSKQSTPHLVAVDLIEHLVSAARIEVVGDPADARPVIAVYQDLDSFELLAHRIFAAREEVDWQVMAYLAELDRIGQTRR